MPMPASANRKQRRAALQPDSSAPAAEEFFEIDFQLMPGPLLGTSLLGDKGLHKKAKSLKLAATVDAHIGGFLSTQPHLSFQDATEALWRVLLREEHNARERAMLVHRQTGLPAKINHSRVYRMLSQELLLMASE
jgi:hypothetical protein